PWTPRTALPTSGKPASGTQHQTGDRAAQFERAAPAGQRWVGHEVVVGDKRFLARVRTAVGTIRRHDPALAVVLEVGDHDLVEHLLVHRRVLAGATEVSPPARGGGLY